MDCLHSIAFAQILGSPVKQKRILFRVDGWGQRVPGQIKGSGLRRRFGRGDNGAALPSSPPHLLPSIFRSQSWDRAVGGADNLSFCIAPVSRLAVWEEGRSVLRAGRELGSRGVDGKCCAGAARGGSQQCFLSILRTSLWFSKVAQMHGGSRLLEMSEVEGKPPKTLLYQPPSLTERSHTWMPELVC